MSAKSTTPSKRLRELWLAVGGLLANSEDPKFVKTGIAMCGTKELANLYRVWKRVSK